MSTWLNQFPTILTRRKRRRPVVQARVGQFEELETRQLLVANPLTVSSVADISAASGQVNGAVATVSDTDGSVTAHDLKAVINWGDGSTSKGHLVAAEGGTFQ